MLDAKCDMTISVILFSIVLALGSCQEAYELRPSITPEAKQLPLQAGEQIYFLCEGSNKIFFFYPNRPNSPNDKVISSRSEIKESRTNGLYTYKFTRANSLPGDTGWYGCAYHNITITPGMKYDDPDINWVYVYVSSPDRLFVDEKVSGIVNAVVRGKAILPCRPTSPTLNVTLSNLDPDKEIVLGKKITFDPRFGFEINSLTVEDSGVFICSARRNNEQRVVHYHLQVLPNIPLSEPIIDKEMLKHVILGKTLRVNCTVTSVPKAFVLNWTVPHQSNRIRTNFQYNIGAHSKGAFNELTIENMTMEDQGEYECFVRDAINKKSVKMYLNLHDPNDTYINLTSQNPNTHYTRKHGERVKWVVYFKAYPEPDLRWFDPNGKEIMSRWPDSAKPKYVITQKSKYIVLTIFSLNISDMGNYTLRATNNNNLQTLNFTLDVLSKPVAILENIESYYTPNQTAVFQCNVTAFPRPNITWSFQRLCPNYSCTENSSLVQLKNIHEETRITSVFSTARIKITHSGVINCTACNSLGCDNSTKKIFASDIGGGFRIIEPRRPIAEGDNVSIVCAASIFTYTEQLIWKKRRTNENENYDVISANERIEIIKEKNELTYRTTLKIDKVQKEDSNFYTCSAFTIDKSNETIEYELKVYDVEPPTFKHTNMNGTTLNIDLATESHKTIILKCFVSGMPKPNVTWYKDDVMLNKSEQYLFLHNNNELRITYLLERDNGKYSCSATNRLKTIEAYVNIMIKGKDMSKGLIAMIAFLAIMVVILIIYFTIKVRREKILRKELLQTGLMHFEEGALECLNSNLTVDDQAELLPYDKKWEFPRERLKLGKQLGCGAFGVVLKAEAVGICDNEAVTTVAVKMVRRTTEPSYVRALASELKIMVHLGKHLNVVNLLGACTKNIGKRELLVIVEYCRFGNLHNYLLRHRLNFINQIDPVTGKFDPMIGIDLLSRATSVSSPNRIKYTALSFSRSISTNSDIESVHYSPIDVGDSNNTSMSPDSYAFSNSSSQPGWRSNYRGDYKDHNLKPICTQDLLSWAFQVARGMDYLSQRKVLHGDLAARNILLAEDNVVKICDFGLAKTMYKDNNYKKKGDGPLPIKWMAIESIRDAIFSTQSDIWSFGIVLWEFFTLAETPYPGMEAEKLYEKLIDGYRMEQPAYATAEVYSIMSQCWKTKPALRPSFTKLVNSIGDLLQENVKAHYINLNTPYIDINTLILNQKNDYLTMMSAPDHVALSSPTHNYVNSPTSVNASESGYLCMSPLNPINESGIFSPRPNPEKSRFEFPSVTSDSEDAVEASPMLQSTENHNQKPINVHERRAEFARQRQVSRNQVNDHATDTNSGYYKTPRNLSLMDMNDQQNDQVTVSKQRDKPAAIDITQDNYVNVLNRRSDLKRDVPDGFSNPNYVVMSNNDVDQTKV